MINQTNIYDEIILKSVKLINLLFIRFLLMKVVLWVLLLNKYVNEMNKVISDYFSAKSRLHREHLQVNKNICKLNCNTVRLFIQSTFLAKDVMWWSTVKSNDNLQIKYNWIAHLLGNGYHCLIFSLFELIEYNKIM